MFFMAVAPFGSLAKAGGKVATAFSYGRKGGRAFDIAESAAKNLFRILPYREAQKLTAGHRGAIQAHHIVEVRHLQNWSESIADSPAVILSAAEHHRITQALRTKLPYTPRGATPIQYEKNEVWPVLSRSIQRIPRMARCH